MGAKAFNVKRDRLADQALDLFDAISSHSDARELGRVGRVTRLAAFNDDRITAHVLGPLNPACQKTLASVPGRNSALGFQQRSPYQACSGGGLAVAAGLPDEPPTIGLDKLDHSADRHGRNLAPSQARLSRRSNFVDSRSDQAIPAGWVARSRP